LIPADDAKVSDEALKELSIVLSDNSAHDVGTPASGLLKQKKLKLPGDDSFLK